MSTPIEVQDPRTGETTVIRETVSGLVAVHQGRELHTLGSEPVQREKALEALQKYSFVTLWRAAARAPRSLGSKVRYLKMRAAA